MEYSDASKMKEMVDALMAETKLAVGSLEARIDAKLEAFAAKIVANVETQIQEAMANILSFVGTTSSGVIDNLKESLSRQSPKVDSVRPNLKRGPDAIAFVTCGENNAAVTSYTVSDSIKPEEMDAVDLVDLDLDPFKLISSIEELQTFNDRIVDAEVAELYVSYSFNLLCFLNSLILIFSRNTSARILRTRLYRKAIIRIKRHYSAPFCTEL